MVAKKRDARVETSEGFTRQRRNLLLSSIVVSFFFWSGITVDKVSVLGTEITIANPRVIFVSLVAFFFYFLLRFYQYCIREPGWEIAKEKRIDRIYGRESAALQQAAVVLCDPMFDFESSIHFFDRTRFGGREDYRFSHKQDERVSWLTYKAFFCLRDIHFNDYNGGQKDYFHNNMENEGWEVVQTKDEKEGELYLKNEVAYNFVVFLKYRIDGICKFVIHDSEFTDYYLPFLVAIVSLASILYGFWNLA